MHERPGPVRQSVSNGGRGNAALGGLSSPDGPGMHTIRTMTEHVSTASPARRIIAARAWGRSLAQLHTQAQTALPDEIGVSELGPYRFEICLDIVRPLPVDASSDLVQAYQWLREHIQRSTADTRAALAAFLDGYRNGGGAGRLAIPA